MADIPCAICGEPWDAWGAWHEFEAEEKRWFFRGDGCPGCRGAEDNPATFVALRETPEGHALAMEAAKAEMAWSDGDPICILRRRGLVGERTPGTTGAWWCGDDA